MPSIAELEDFEVRASSDGPCMVRRAADFRKLPHEFGYIFDPSCIYTAPGIYFRSTADVNTVTSV